MSRLRGFGWSVAAIAIAGLAIRVVYVLTIAPDRLGGDGTEFHTIAKHVADGDGFALPSHFYYGPLVPWVDKPPLYVLFLAGATEVAGSSVDAHRLASCLVGAGTVAALGFLGRRVGGPRVGLIAAALGAVYPLLWVADGTVMSESLLGLLTALVLIAALRLLEQPESLWRAAALGAAVACAALTRSEAILLLPLLILPVVLLAKRFRVRNLAVAAAVMAVVIAPWVIRNAVTFDEPVGLSTNLGTLVAGANCDQTYYGDHLGVWISACLPRHPPGRKTNLRANTRAGLDYAGDHLGRVPVVVGARVLRLWGLYRPGQQLFDPIFREGRNSGAVVAGQIVFYLALVAAAFGAWQLRRRRDTLVVLAAPVVMVTIMAALAYGIMRFRLPAEIPIVVLASVALARLGGRPLRLPS